MAIDDLPPAWREVPTLAGRHAHLEPMAHAHVDGLRAALLHQHRHRAMAAVGLGGAHHVVAVEAQRHVFVVDDKALLVAIQRHVAAGLSHPG